ncbi:TetR/AcrR family transcriptional regulator [Neobacillus piezotolerans]|uniref:TetR/AcrR family transcriptional regulator n=1 Tax=Neobacillus piezotolerans TaxID=2259171 RepID=A0A3D8GNB1_9BACI|nr:TetR/AcrR family transcriptional regulator [Neobacillus piezotolerans]RDU35762.1 TetR/AcrR family transcriptional regulator [Neobacillus piezotolerans]
MKEWIPIPGSSKNTLVQVALEEFSAKGYKKTNIAELAEKADMTTGAIYHHFGSKAGLYEIIRSEMEQRILDRMEGAASLFADANEALEAALITGLDFAAKSNCCRLIGEEPISGKKNKIAVFFEEMNTNDRLPLEIIMLASWRSLLLGIADRRVTVEQAKDIIKWIFKRELE